ncbi:MAG: zinc-ribbon domain-containing protein [Nitrosopumilus sp.]|nr:zinc-ribbon domain-containing protein [Nitrosopumilus sp.]
MFCKKCGTELKEDSNFCAKCGRKINEQDPNHDHIEEKSKKLQRPVEWKGEAITVILAIVLTGLGHFYINHFQRGAIFLGIGFSNAIFFS